MYPPISRKSLFFSAFKGTMELPFYKVLLLLTVCAQHATCDRRQTGVVPRRYGRGMRSDFALDYNYININSGSVGAYPNPVRREVEKLRERSLGKPDGIEYPMSNNEVLAKLERFLNETHDPTQPIRIAIIDHISSLPTILNPLEKMIEILKRYNIPVIVDAAHAIGQVKIDIRKLDPDFYVTDVHKWGMAPAPTAVLYVKKQHQGIVHPAIVSQYYRVPTDYQKEFWWTGTWDNLNYAAVPLTFEYRKRIGGEQKIMDYNNKLIVQGATLVAKTLGTRLLQDRDQMAAMGDVQIPLKNPEDPKYTEDYWIELQLTKYPNCFAPIYKQSGQWWARLSAQVYNDISDFRKGAQHLLDVIKDAESSSTKGNSFTDAFGGRN